MNFIPTCTRKRSYPVITKLDGPSFFPHEMFSNNEFSIVEFDCYLRERTVPILRSFIKKNQMSVRFYFRIFSRFLSRTITRSNMKINSEKLNLIPACTRKRSLSCRCQINPPVVHHSSHPKCFKIMNIQIVAFDCYLHKWTVTILPSFIKNKCQLVRFYFLILSRTIKTKKL